MPSSDPLLAPFLEAQSDVQASDLLGALIAEPTVRYIAVGTVGRRGVGSTADVSDVQAEVVLRLVTKLRDLRGDRTAEPIANFPVPPAPQAEFVVLDAGRFAEISEVRAAHPDAHLLLSVMLYDAGAKEAARKELEALAQANPESDVAR